MNHRTIEPTHVDLVENHWSGGYQQRVARVVIEGEHLAVDGDPHWRDLILQRFTEDTGHDLHALASHFKSDYTFATDPHDDASCPFAANDKIPMT